MTSKVTSRHHHHHHQYQQQHQQQQQQQQQQYRNIASRAMESSGTNKLSSSSAPYGGGLRTQYKSVMPTVASRCLLAKQQLDEESSISSQTPSPSPQNCQVLNSLSLVNSEDASLNNQTTTKIVNSTSKSPSLDPMIHQLENTKENNQEEDSAKQHHVGPVMGIFFKVWSLVKVTKMRQQKMRRQNSEDASQFHYISGDQISASGDHRNQMLEDSHFRRAGSQPAPSTSARVEAPSMLQLSTSANAENCSLLLAPSGKNIGESKITRESNSNTSSGVSSANSSNQLTLCNQRLHSPASHQTTAGTGQWKYSSSDTYNVHNLKSSGMSEQYYENSSAIRQKSSSPFSFNNNNNTNANTNINTSWASKIKRSATTVNPSDFSNYVSRYRSSRRNQRNQQAQKQSTTIKSNNSCYSSDIVTTSTTKPSSSMVQSFSSVRATGAALAAAIRQRSIPPDSQKQHNNETVSDNIEFDNNDIEYDNDDDDDDQKEAEEEEEEAAEEVEEEDSNDIYSTPNDSIQSVPSTGPMICSEQLEVNGMAVHQVTGQAYPIIKSFSTSNFNQLLRQQPPTSNGIYKFKPIDELERIDNNNNNNNCISKHGKISGIYGNQNGSKQHFQVEKKDSNPLQNGKRLNDSRFFISSSSSEDSNSPNQHPTTTTASATATTNTTIIHNSSSKSLNADQNQQSSSSSINQSRPSYQLDQQQQQLSLQQGVHIHCPTHHKTNNMHLMRPFSILLESPETGMIVPVSLFSPTSISTTAYNGNPILIPSSIEPTTHQLQHSGQFLPGSMMMNTSTSNYIRSPYKKSPSMMEISNTNSIINSRFNSQYPIVAGFQQQSKLNLPSTNLNQSQQQQKQLSSFKPTTPASLLAPAISAQRNSIANGAISYLPNSISLYDYKMNNFNQMKSSNENLMSASNWQLFKESLKNQEEAINSKYKFAQMLLESGSNPNTKDSDGYTALMHAILSDNTPAIKCLVEHGVNLNETNKDGLGALDLICSKAPTSERLKILRLLIDNQANLDKSLDTDGSRLLDRLIKQHQLNGADKMPFIDCLLQNGAKLGSTTWSAASGKQDVQLRLLRKLCQDGYFLYKQGSIEGAVFRFEYALKRIAELEQQLTQSRHLNSILKNNYNQNIQVAVRQIKYQTYLGLSRCERKRKFYKRALEFANLAILVDSTSYEGFYSKAHILKDIGELDDSLMAIDQTSRLVERSIESLAAELRDLEKREESMIFDGCFNMLDSRKADWIETTRLELTSTIDYLYDAKKYISRLKAEIMDDRFKQRDTSNKTFSTNPLVIV